MVERFNRRLAELLRAHPAAGSNSGKNKFLSHDERNAYILDFVEGYNRTRLRCLDYLAPLQVQHKVAEDNTCAGMTPG
ncbi:MAG TPA: hypothetical protein VET30_05985 [Pseudoxanthomonas sp.]|nr:hypothetical protein [Pseudoxanthomonas sp.]